MKNRLGLISWATGTLMLAAVSACGDNDADPPPTRRADIVVQRNRSTDDQRVADLAVRRGDRRGNGSDDGLLRRARRAPASDPSSDLKKLETVATSAQLNAVQTLVGRQQRSGTAPDRPTAISELTGPVGQPRQLRPDGRQGADGRHRRLLGRQQGRRARQERQVDRLPHPPGHRVDALHRRELRLRRRSDRWLARGDGPGPQADAMRGILIRVLLTALSAARPLRPCPRRRRTRTPCARRPTQRRASASSGSRCRAPRARQVSRATTGRRTPATERPATGTAPSQGITKPPPGPVPCSSPRGYWSNSYHCYISPVEPAAAGGRSELAGPRARRRRGLQLLPAADRVCSSPSGRRTRRPNSGSGTDAARGGADRDRADAVCRRSTSASRPSRVRTASAWSACRSGCGPRTRTPTPSARSPTSASAGGITVTATAKVLDITWDMGDGTEVVCDTAGTPYKPEFGRKDSPDCGHTYKKSSARPDG